MNIFIREMRANRKALIIWSVCMFLFVLSGMSKYTAYSSGGAAGNVFAEMPKTLRVLLGMGTLDVTTMPGFFAFLFPYLEITTAIHAALLGCGIIGKEERDKTTEFLIAKPVSRKTVITSKFVAALINVIVVNVVTLISSIVMVGAYNKGESINSEILTFMLVMFLVQLIFLSLGAVLAAFIRKPKAAGSIATSILLIGYVISKVTALKDNLEFLNVLSPFQYFNLDHIAEGKGVNAVILLLSLLLVGVFSVFTYYFYQKRDLNV